MEDTESRRRGWVEEEEGRLGCTTCAEIGGFDLLYDLQAFC